MPSRKAEQIALVLREEILSGARAPGAKLPTYDALMEQFQVTRPTVAREQPGSLEWTSFMATFLDLIERGETGIPGQVVPLVGVDGRANNPAYKLLCEVVEQRSAAGLLLMNSSTVYQLPALEKEGLPRAAIWAPLPHAGLVSLAFDSLLERACTRLMEKGKRLAIMSPHEPNLKAAEAYLMAQGLPEDQLWPLHVAVV